MKKENEKNFGELTVSKTRNTATIEPFALIDKSYSIKEVKSIHGKALRAFKSGNEMLISVLLNNELNKAQLIALLEISGLSTKGKEGSRVNGFLTFDRGNDGNDCIPRKGYRIVNVDGVYKAIKDWACRCSHSNKKRLTVNRKAFFYVF